MADFRTNGEAWPGQAARQSGDDEAEDSIVIDYGAIVITYLEVDELLRLENVQDERGAGEIGEDAEALLSAFVRTGFVDEFSFETRQVAPAPAGGPLPRESVVLTFTKIEHAYRDSDDRDDALRHAADLEDRLEADLGRDLDVRVTGGGKAGFVIRIDDRVLPGGGDDGQLPTDLADYDLIA